jgi:hypothetical protein
VFSYDAPSRTATTKRGGTPLYAFTAADLTDSSGSMLSYVAGTRRLVVTCETDSAVSIQRYSADLRNPALGVAETTYRAQISGVPTTTDVASGVYAVASLPLEIFRTDVLDPATRSEAVANSAPVVLTYERTAGTIRGSFRTTGSEPVDVAITIDRMIGSRFNGTLVASNGAKGTVDGGFYGTEGREIGFVTTFEKFGIHYAGAGSGRRR